jgi:hypothetical protein
MGHTTGLVDWPFAWPGLALWTGLLPGLAWPCGLAFWPYGLAWDTMAVPGRSWPFLAWDT